MNSQLWLLRIGNQSWVYEVRFVFGRTLIHTLFLDFCVKPNELLKKKKKKQKNVWLLDWYIVEWKIDQNLICFYTETDIYG